MKKAVIFLGLGSEIGFLVFGAYYLGEKLDETYKTDGLIFVTLAILCLIGWITQVIWLLRAEESEEDQL